MTVTIGSRVVGGGSTFVIAELGVNHNGNVTLAHRLVDAAADAGADAVKLQTFDPGALVSTSTAKAPYQANLTGPGGQLEMLRALALNDEEHFEIASHARERGLMFLSTPFDKRSLDFLVDQIDVPAIKIGSGDLTNRLLLEHAARRGRPMLVSTGASTLEEVAAAAAIVTRAGAPLVLFHCVTAYPAPAIDANLRAMDTLRERFQVPVGWSDHIDGTIVALAAVARGAAVIEKHLTLDRSMSGPDHRASTEPADFARLVAEARLIGEALGEGLKLPAASERETAYSARRSLHAAKEITTGERLHESSLAALRPADGISPMRIADYLGKAARRDIGAGELLKESDFE